jgi:methyltransferase (TIGR00027 family)
VSASRTAQYVAFYRALETVRRRPVVHDPYASRFLSPGLARAVRAARAPLVHSLVARYADRRAPGARTSAIGRTKIIDDAVLAAVASGTRQLVILGAGFDCRAHRMPELAGVAVFEVDRAETQAEKRTRLGDLRTDVRYVTVDFLRDEVSARLVEEGWDSAAPTCFLWEGVTNYLTASAVDQVLAWVGGSAPGSTLVFTYIHGGLLDGTVPFDGGSRMISNVRTLGEPWTFGLHPSEVAPLLARHNLTLREDLGADDYRRRTGITELAGYAFYRLAVAEVG